MRFKKIDKNSNIIIKKCKNRINRMNNNNNNNIRIIIKE